jgi:LmbE family N-acetylglucosaminyl deacetylase
MTTLGWGSTLVVVAHADDETLGAGGTIARLVAEGSPVTVAVATDSTSAQYPGDSEIYERRWRHFRDAMRILGVTDWAEFGAPDMGLASVRGPELADWVSTQIKRVQAETVLTCFPGDANEDHRAIARATGIATRPRAGSSVRRLLWFETLSSTEWAPLQGLPEFRPTVGVDISATLESKLVSFACYVDEVRPSPDPRSSSIVRAKAVARGSQWGFSAAEAFESAMVRH